MTTGDATDGELLHRFLHEHDDGAFTALVQRHGPAVLGVCRRVLRDPNDAEDAFQATFLVLIKKAGSIARTALLASWLYGVAYRTALAARTQAARRRAKERQVVPMPPAEPTPEVVWTDLRPVLDQEVNRLPEKYRAAFVLCHLEGRTNEEAAGVLGCPRGTILSRLAWARERLRYRLSRRGVALSAGLLTSLLSSSEVSPAVTPALLVRTANAALSVAAGQAIPAGAVSEQVATLIEGVVRAMWVKKLKALASVLLVMALLGGACLFTYHGLRADDKNEVKKGKSDREKLQGTWVLTSADHGGQKAGPEEIKDCTLTIKGDKCTLTMQGQTQEGTISLGPSKKPRQIDLTVDEGGGAQTHLGIYVLEGDTFKLCMSHPPQERPTKFATKKGAKWPGLFVFKRQEKAKPK
jgi:RNA polymerase sigma factor (sigma-70 family)